MRRGIDAKEILLPYKFECRWLHEPVIRQLIVGTGGRLYVCIERPMARPQDPIAAWPRIMERTKDIPRRPHYADG